MAGTPLGLAFMQTFPDYPVLKLRIEPGDTLLAQPKIWSTTDARRA